MTLTDWLSEKQMTPARFARRSQVNTATLSRFLTGRSGLSARTVRRIERATQGAVTFDELMAEAQRLQRLRGRADQRASERTRSAEA